MSIESFIQAMPKAEIHLQLEGAIPKDLIMMIADQIDIASTYKKARDYREYVSLLEDPPYTRFDEVARETASWIRHPEDLARAVYDVGLALHKQNVRYAEISLVPSVFAETGLSYQALLRGINDGRDRVERAWGVQIRWIFSIPRENPRKADETARWATSSTGQSGFVRGLGLVGKEETQPIAQFKKAFQDAKKKDLPRIVHWHTGNDAEDYADVLDIAEPLRVTDAWSLVDDEEMLSLLAEKEIPLVITPSRELRYGHIRSVSNYPFQALQDAGIPLIIGSGMPNYYETTLLDEYLLIVQDGGISIDELQTMAARAVEYSTLPEMEKADLYSQFQQAYAELAEEHLNSEAEAEVEETE